MMNLDCVTRHQGARRSLPQQQPYLGQERDKGTLPSAHLSLDTHFGPPPAGSLHNIDMTSHTTKLHQLNCKTFSDAFVAEGTEYLLQGSYPERARWRSQRRRFRQKYAGFEAHNGNLYYGKLLVVPESRRDDVLRGHYEQVGDIGRDRFYNLLTRKYLGITRRQTHEFLANQEVHQLALPVRRQKISRPITTSAPMERWQADLIDMRAYKSPQNKQTTYILTIIDCFSKRAWAVPLTKKSGEKVAKAMDGVLKEHGAPQIIQTDVGREFLQEFDGMLAGHGVKHIKSNPYSPRTNGQIERFNGTLKRMVHAHMRRHGTRIYVPALQQLIDAFNTIPHTTTRMAPDELHTANPQQLHHVSQRVHKQLAKALDKSKRNYTTLKAGDNVRVAKLIDPATTPKPTTFWESDIDKVVEVLHPQKDWMSDVYVLESGRRVTRDKLQKVDVSKLVRIAPRKADTPEPPIAQRLPKRKK